MIVGTRILRALVKLVCATLWLTTISVQGHPGRTDAEGCHAGALPRHCHGSTQTDRPAQQRPGSPAREAGRPAPRKPASEDEYNQLFCATVNGETETRHRYTYAGGSSFVKVDCETSTTVYEGGLDKRSSLDSLQQALFLSHLTGKRPAVVIHDTDGQEGRFEYRIRTACQKVGVRYEVFR